MKEKLQNKIALVTGASRGIGAEIAFLLAENGATVVLHHHQNQSAAQKTFKRLPGSGHIILNSDLSKPDEAKNLIHTVLSTYGKIDILINNAGIYDMLDFHRSNFDDWQNHWQKNLNLNLMAPVNLSYFAAIEMKKNGGGRIINISSRGAFRGEPQAPAYGAAKAALNAFSQSMAQALANDKVLVYTIAPGFVETDMSAPALNSNQRDDFLNQSPFKRVAKPAEIAEIALFCAFDAPEFMTAAIIDVNGASYLRT